MALSRLDILVLIVLHYTFIELCTNIYVLENISITSIGVDIAFNLLYIFYNLFYTCIRCPSDWNNQLDNNYQFELFSWLAYAILVLDTIIFTCTYMSDTINTPKLQDLQYITFGVIKLTCKIFILIAWLCIICKELCVDEETMPILNKRRPPTAA
jgi:hypothetical protein